jgi:hypothetical protein
MKLGVNIMKTPVHVMHASLKRYSEDSDYLSHCPVCGTGILLVARNQSTFELVRWDRCTFCGQSFLYDDESIGGESLEALEPDFEKSFERYLKSSPPGLMDNVNN